MISLTQMIEELRKSIHNDTNPAYRHSYENADLNYRLVFAFTYFASYLISMSLAA